MLPVIYLCAPCLLFSLLTPHCIIRNFFGGGKQISSSDVRDAMLTMDEDNSGEVDFDEFKAWWQARKHKHSDGSTATTVLQGQSKADSEARNTRESQDTALDHEGKVRQLFNLYSANSDNGEIDAADLHKIMTSLGHIISREEAVSLLQAIDADNSGSMDFNEFFDMIEGRSGAGSELVEKLRASAFSKVDDQERRKWAHGVFLRFPSGVYHPVFSMEARNKAINELGAVDTVDVDPRAAAARVQVPARY
jgi:Ca2+-binding EF-hand superfamily protein